MNKFAEVGIVVMGLFSLWIWVAFVVVNAMSSRPVGYVVGQICAWDVGIFVAVVLCGGWWVLRWPEDRRLWGVRLTAVSYMGLCGYLFFAGHPAAGGVLR